MSRTLLLVASFLLGGCALLTGPALPNPSGPLRDDRALSFQLPLHPQGTLYDLKQDRGKVVLLDVWATWCEPCRDSLPMWQDLAKEYARRGLVVYALSLDEDPAQISPFLEEIKVQLPVLHDRGGTVAESVLRVRMMPTSYLIDRRGVIRFVHEGFAEDQLTRYQSEIELLLRER